MLRVRQYYREEYENVYFFDDHATKEWLKVFERSKIGNIEKVVTGFSS